MTIAVGFVCKDGIVLAADTKESYGEDAQTFVDKISVRDVGECQFGIAGAGTDYLLDYITPRIMDLLVKGDPWPNVAQYGCLLHGTRKIDGEGLRWRADKSVSEKFRRRPLHV